jgi:hypothetical protein
MCTVVGDVDGDVVSGVDIGTAPVLLKNCQLQPLAEVVHSVLLGCVESAG